MTKLIAILMSLGALGIAALATVAIAMGEGEGVVEVDANGDGLMTVDEVQAVYPDITAEAFAEIDTNNDGALDDSEMVAGQEKGLIIPPSDG